MVDDDKNVLSGLQRMLHQVRSNWDLHFANGGQEALDLIRGGTEIDVVVTDLHMPGMHGTEMLSEISQIDPEIIRIVLSGNLNADDLSDSANIAHQIVAKPCDPDHFRSVLARAFTLRRRMENSPVKMSLMQMGTLPSVPVLYWRIMDEINSPSPSIARVAEIVSKDPGMTAKVLKVANSTTNPQNRVTDIVYATHMIGLENLKSFVLAAELFDKVSDEAKLNAFDIDALWHHGLTVGEYSMRIAEFQGADKQTVDASYTAGLLHDIGLLILATKLPKDFAAVLECAKTTGSTLYQAERKTLGVTHAEIGAYLLDLWGLHDNVVKAISHHFFPSGDEHDIYSFQEDEDFSPLTAVHSANYFCEEAEATDDEYGKAELDMVYLESLGLGEMVPMWWDLCKDELTV
jgi:HD-like signal output (HDOD) protein/CheY-like chemotaxis protein